MSNDDIQKQKMILRDLLLAFSGAVLVLLMTSTDRGCFAYESTTYSGLTVPITPWFAPWLLLQVVSIFFTVGILFEKGWKQIPFDEKAGHFFGFLALVWACLLAFSLRLSEFLSFYWYLLLVILGMALITTYLVYRLKKRNAGDYFP